MGSIQIFLWHGLWGTPILKLFRSVGGDDQQGHFTLRCFHHCWVVVGSCGARRAAEKNGLVGPPGDAKRVETRCPFIQDGVQLDRPPATMSCKANTMGVFRAPGESTAWRRPSQWPWMRLLPRAGGLHRPRLRCRLCWKASPAHRLQLTSSLPTHLLDWSLAPSRIQQSGSHIFGHQYTSNGDHRSPSPLGPIHPMGPAYHHGQLFIHIQPGQSRFSW